MTSQYRSIPDIYPPAAARHLKGSNALITAGEHEEAAYLAGYVTECVLKQLLMKMAGDNPRDYYHNVSQMSKKVVQFAAQNYAQFNTCRYIKDPSSKISSDITVHWIPDLRYKPDNTITLQIAQQWILEASAHYRILQEMRRDGYK